MKTTILSLILSFLFLNSCDKTTGKMTTEKIIYENDFATDDKQWFIGNEPYANYWLNHGVYTIYAKENVPADVWMDGVFNGKPSDGTVETSMKVSPVRGNFGYAALLFNRFDGRVCQFSITSDGRFTIDGFTDEKDESTKKVFVVPTTSSALKMNDFNKLRITLQKGTLHFFINETEVHEMPQLSQNLDCLGFCAFGNSKLEVDYVKISKPE